MTSLETALLKLERYSHSTKNDKTVLLLRALVEHAPTQAGRDHVTLEIASCEDDEQLRQLGTRYINGLLIPMRAQGGKTPPVSSHPSKPSEVTNEADIEYLIETAKRDQKVLKDLCLRRDHFRCVISGYVDYMTWRRGGVQCPKGKRKDFVVAAHIIPFSVAAKSNAPAVIQDKFFLPTNNSLTCDYKMQRSRAIFEIMNRFGGLCIEELHGMQINRIENILTLGSTIHFLFGLLDIWLETVEGVKDTYRLHHAVEGASEVPAGTIITFQSADPGLPLPDPRYIAFHAACAKVLHASGVVEDIDQYLRDYEGTRVLAKDGSSSKLLDDALRMISMA